MSLRYDDSFSRPFELLDNIILDPKPQRRNEAPVLSLRMIREPITPGASP